MIYWIEKEKLGIKPWVGFCLVEMRKMEKIDKSGWFSLTESCVVVII